MMKPFQPFSMALICLIAMFSAAKGSDQFALAVGAHDKLVVFGPKGERVIELSVPSIAQPVSAGGVSFQVSYGRDSEGQLTAIIAPSSSAPGDLHFSVLGKSVDADQAVVTLVFSTNTMHVSIRAGVGGSVQVNSRRIAASVPRP